MSSRLAPLVLLLTAAGFAFCGVPQASAQDIAKPSGSLLLIGGRHQDLSNELRDLFFELAGGNKARIVVIPTAVADAGLQSPHEFLKPWQESKPLSVQILHTRDPKTANDPAFVKPLTEATAVFFTNGHLHRVFDAYRGTLVENELKKLQARGGLIGGTGTGTTVLCDLVSNRDKEDRLTQPGLGLLPGFLIMMMVTRVALSRRPRRIRLASASQSIQARPSRSVERTCVLSVKGVSQSGWRKARARRRRSKY